MVEAETVRSLLQVIEARLTRLEEAANVPLDAYRRDRDLQDIVDPALVHANLDRLDDVRDYVAALVPILREHGISI